MPAHMSCMQSLQALAAVQAFKQEVLTFLSNLWQYDQAPARCLIIRDKVVLQLQDGMLCARLSMKC